ncbi:MAG: NPCBM/NEW2 domain-containing protein [Planctomycetes bacterium]|nr:NPCBM/NEW2 domain-containing protein [Planctomycetota bacterium]
MPVWHILLLSAALQLPTTEIETLKGERATGELVELNDSSAVLKQGTQSVSFPLPGLLAVRFPQAPPAEPSLGSRLSLVDGSRLTCSSFSVTGDKARCQTAFGNLTLTVSRLSSVRFGVSTPKLDENWNALLTRESTTDLLVVKKEDVLDFLAGVTGDVGEKINLLLDGEVVPVTRDKAYGIVYHRRLPTLPKSICQIQLTSGDVLETTQLTWEAGKARAKLVAGPEVEVPQGQIAALDFSVSKIKYLSDLKPRDTKYVPFFDVIGILDEYRRDRSLDGTPITLKGRSYPRGIALHSKTMLRFRIAGEYSRFQATAGIDDTVAESGHCVQLLITGDGKPLFDGEIKGREAPRPLDLDVSGVRDLEITVDFGSDNSDIGDHLDLADAKLVK